MTIRAFCLAAVAAMSVSAGMAQANAIRQMTLEEKVAKADLVVVGTVTGADRARVKIVDGSGRTSEAEWPYYIVEIRAALKGAPAETLRLYADDGVAETALPNDMVGHDYVFFLTQGRDGNYSSILGHNGYVPIARDPNTYRLPPVMTLPK